jgi:hypothetical protein
MTNKPCFRGDDFVLSKKIAIKDVFYISAFYFTLNMDPDK